MLLIRRFALVLTLLVALALGGVTVAQETTSEATGEATVEPDATAEATPETTPEPSFPGAGSYNVRQVTGGIERSYRIYIPDTAFDPVEPVPLVIVLHGAGGTGPGIESFSGFNALADRENFVVIYPSGVGGAWNDGRNNDQPQDFDDVGYLGRVMSFLGRQLNIDPDRVYAAGYSMGGMLAYRLACDLPDVFAGVASVASTFPAYLADDCEGTPPVPVLIIQGTDDEVVPWTGYVGGYFSATTSLTWWAEHNGCETTSGLELAEDVDPDDGTRVLTERYSDCEDGADVALYAVYGGGHSWPGHVIGVGGLLGRTTQDMDGTEAIWEFWQSL